MPPSEDPARRAVVTGIGAVTPIGNDAADVLGEPHRRRVRRRADHVVRPDRLRRPHRRRGQGLRPDDRDGPQDGPPDEPLHPLRDGRGDRGGRPRRARLQRLADRAARSHRGRHQHRRRGHGAGHRRDGDARAQGSGPGQPVRDPGAVGVDGRGAREHEVRPHGAGHHPGGGVRQRRDRVPGRAAADPLAASATSSSPAGRRRRSCRSRSRRWATWAPCRSATTTRPTPRGRSTGIATASCSARVRRSSSSNRWHTRSHAGPAT